MGAHHVALALALALAGCGRIGFDAGDGDDAPGGSDAPPNNGDGANDGNDVPPANETCATATILAIGTPMNGTVANATDDLDTLFCTDGPDVVYRVDVASTTNLDVSLTPTFFATISFSTSCPPTSGACSTVSTGSTNTQPHQFQTGDNYLIVDGPGTTFEIGVSPTN